MDTTRLQEPARRRTWLAAGALAAAVLSGAGACGNGDAPTALTAQEVCALISDAEVGELIGSEDISREAGPSSAPTSCVYSYTRVEGVDGIANLLVSVITGDRVDGKTGSAALAHLAEEAGAADASPLDGVAAENVHHAVGSGHLVLAVDPAGRVASLLLDSDLTTERQAAVTNALVDRLADHT